MEGKMVKKIDIPVDNNIINMPIEEAMPDNYLPYAVEVAKDRALPDVRDGLKPVHRRILYGAYMLKAFPDKPYYKSARIVGDILGKYHPHGDASVYDAMVILAQNFTTRMPLIDGHGNWGSQDGDSAAAMRYTEARLTPIALEMIRDIDKDVVNMVENYSGTELEPEVLPSRYPNLLVNGAFGIAVGLATNIPPHNLKEVVDASLAYIDNPEINTHELMKYVKGPDLPTGGIIIGKNSLISAYETGEGRVSLRAKTSIEELENGRLGIVITEFPYRRSKAKLLQTISEMTADKKHSKALDAISDIRDESDRTGTRAVIEFKKSIDMAGAEKVLKYLFKKTDMQCSISFNMVAVADGKPETMGLKTIISYYIKHQKDVVTRRTKKELEIASKRFHIVEGFIKAIGIMDQIIETIRSSKSKKDAAANLINKYGFTDLQAEAILELMLYRLTGLEVKAFEKEYKELEKLIKRLKSILENDKELMKVIKSELKEIGDKYSEPRRTTIIEDDEEAKIDLEELIIDEDIIVTMSQEGFIKRVPLKYYNRLSSSADEIEYREGDKNRFLFESNTRSQLVFFTDKGNMYQIKGIYIPECKWKEKGEKIDSLIKGLDLQMESIVSAFSISDMCGNKDFIFFTDKGGIKKTGLDSFVSSYTKLQAVKLRDDERLISINLLPQDREESFLHIKTLSGLDFTFEEPVVQRNERNIMTNILFNLSPFDKVLEVSFSDNTEFKTFSLSLEGKEKLKIASDSKRLKANNIACDSSSSILFFTDDGRVFKYQGFMLQNINEDGIPISSILDGNIIKIIAVKDFDEKQQVIFISKLGFIKKTLLGEFEGNYFSEAAYKLKNESDRLIGIELVDGDAVPDIMIITERGMGIRFSLEDVNLMGRIASGVTAVSLGDADTIFYYAVLKRDNNGTLIIKSKKKSTKSVPISDIKIQNRAGRGKNLILIVMDDAVNSVQIKMEG
jgi:topoisomerase-4 subunit A